MIGPDSVHPARPPHAQVYAVRDVVRDERVLYVAVLGMAVELGRVAELALVQGAVVEIDWWAVRDAHPHLWGGRP